MAETVQAPMYLDRAVQGALGLDRDFVPSHYTEALADFAPDIITWDTCENVAMSVLDTPAVRQVMAGLEVAMDGQPDTHSIEHSGDVSILAIANCVALRLPRDFVTYAGEAAMMHDNWKDDEDMQAFIQLPRVLSRDEKKQYVHPHPTQGALRAKEAGCCEVTCQGIACHHAFSKDGYGLNPREVFGDFELQGTRYDPALLVATSVTVADVYQAARSARPEKGPASHEEAMDWVESLQVPWLVKRTFSGLFKASRRATIAARYDRPLQSQFSQAA